MLQMQRIHDNPPTIASLPSTSSAPAQPSSAPRSRRASGYPPLSHQDQIMKAMSRSSTLPSLSISIPPSPSQDPPSKTSDPREEPHPAKEERTKTVTFSDPEEDESNLSDQSSICHSPSWEGWSKKTKRSSRPESRDDQKNKEESSGKTPRKKGNRLSKAPPQNPLAISAGRSQSAPQLEPYHKLDRVNASASQLDQQRTMPLAQVNQKQSSLHGDGKSKSKRFLSGFKLPHGGVSGMKKQTENSAKTTETNRPGHGRSSSTLSINKSHSAGPEIDLSFTGSHKSSAEPSIRSHSSLDKRPPMVRPPSSSSGHGRSQSLLSSTLNKLRGPSYLYYRPHEGRNSKSSFRPASRDNESPQPPGQSEDRPSSTAEPVPVTSKPTFAQRFRHKSTTSDISIPLDLPITSQPPTPRDPHRSYDSSESQQLPSRYGDRSSAQVSDSESTIRNSQEDIQNMSGSRGDLHEQQHPDTRNRKPQVESAGSERGHNVDDNALCHAGSQTPRLAETTDNVEQESIASSQDEDYLSAHEHQSDPASGTTMRRGDRGRAVAQKSFPVFRPSSREKHDSPSATPRHTAPSPLTPTSNVTGRAVTSVPDVESKTTKDGRASKVEKSELRNEGNMRIPTQQIRPKRSTDYFTFINESYAPPSLELRSPLENLLQSLNKSKSEGFEKVEIADALRNRSSSRQTVESGKSISSDSQTTMSKGKTGDNLAKSHKQQDSPAMRPRISEHDAPSFERLGASSKATKAFSGSDTGSTSTKQSQQQDTSHSTSERSSSSTFGDAPPSPSSMTTPDSSRPHSHKSRPPSHLDLTRNVIVASSSRGEEKQKARSFPLSPRDRSSSRSRPTSKEAVAQDDSWSRSALPIDLENYSSISLGGADGLASSPALVSTPTSMTFADALKEEIAEELSSRSNSRESLPPRAQSALDLPSANFLPPLKHRSLNPKKNTGKPSVTVVSAPSSPLSEPVEEPLKPALKKTRNGGSSGQEPQVLVSSGAAYLQEARKTVSGAPVPAARSLRPQFAHRNTTIGAKGATTPGRAEPMAKMLVECCSCHFFHDMPARVYECMAKPDSIVEDKTLGVSAAITTMVKCPWCGHGMTTQCCAGYAAVVYLKEKLHGK